MAKTPVVLDQDNNDQKNPLVGIKELLQDANFRSEFAAAAVQLVAEVQDQERKRRQAERLQDNDQEKQNEDGISDEELEVLELQEKLRDRKITIENFYTQLLGTPGMKDPAVCFDKALEHALYFEARINELQL